MIEWRADSTGPNGVYSTSFTEPAGTYSVLVHDYFGDSSSCTSFTVAAISPVGGVLQPVNKLALFAPYMGLLAVVASVAVVIVRPWKKPEN